MDGLIGLIWFALIIIWGTWVLVSVSGCIPKKTKLKPDVVAIWITSENCARLAREYDIGADEFYPWISKGYLVVDLRSSETRYWMEDNVNLVELFKGAKHVKFEKITEK